MHIQSIHHVAINAKDFDASVEFYGSVLGFRRKETVPMDGFSITYFEIPGGGRMELFDYGGWSKDTPREESDVGLRHIAFSVDDVSAAEKMLRGKGVRIVLPATDIPSLRAKVLLFLDPNGVTLEFCQKI
ncbi:MAG: VOC family protein [Spirochaetia bacterium]|jgi:glyoxylase I family protein